jgi:hypothetical protein
LEFNPKLALNWVNSLRYYSKIATILERYQMPVTLNPTRRDDRRAEKFITEAGKQSASANKKPLLVRFDAETMERIAQAAKRLNISRSAFVASSTVREPERMEA